MAANEFFFLTFPNVSKNVKPEKKHQMMSMFLSVENDKNLPHDLRADLKKLFIEHRNDKNFLDQTEKMMQKMSDRYDATSSQPERMIRHQESLSEIIGDHKNDNLDNYLMYREWLPWAQKSRFISTDDCLFAVSRNGEIGYKMRSEQIQTSWAIPSNKVIYYMKSVSKPIIEIGSGRGYWTKLLRKAGCHVTAVDNGADENKRALIRDTVKMDGTKYIKQGRASKDKFIKQQDTSLFFCYPRKKEEGGIYVVECIAEFRGSDVFFVGELAGNCFEFQDWLDEVGGPSGWQTRAIIRLPCYADQRDLFVHITKTN